MLSLYASGRTTGVVLDSGDGVTHVVPVYEGYALPHAILRMDIAGRAVTQQLQRLLRRSGYVFQSSAEQEIVRGIKESCCAVAFSPSKIEEDFNNSQQGSVGTGRQRYKLPDGSNIELGLELYRAPEVLFQPDLLGVECRGVHDLLVSSIQRTDIDLRRTLYSQIVLAGGSTMFPGYGERLLHEVRRHASAPKETKIRIAAPPERLHSTWIGGSILASLSTFKALWLSRKDYLEHGARALHQKHM
jgi:centractin